MADSGSRAAELVLLADDDALSRDFMVEVLRGLGLGVFAVADGDAACSALAERSFDVVVTDLKMPGRDGLEVLAEAKRRESDRPVVLVTAHGTMHVAVAAMREGADDILEKPVGPEDLELALLRVRERRRLLRENRFLRDQSVGDDLEVCGDAMRAVVAMVARVARSDAPVLILGESGTGKERVAGLVHKRSDRHGGPFVKVNCGAIPETLIESELFGHEAGAFTGANVRREGRFELADGGTLFLDEVGEMPASMQVKLLRVLQEGEFSRVGGNRVHSVDVRIVAATNRDLATEVVEGRFREDLFYRLNVVPVRVPPLRERRDEIGPLARVFLARDIALGDDAEQCLLAHDWPGNVRELQNVVQRAGLLCEGGVIDADQLERWLGTVRRAPATAPTEAPIGSFVGRSLGDVEAELIQATLAACDGNRTRAAKILGIGVRTLFNKLRRVDRPDTKKAQQTIDPLRLPQ